MISPQRISSFKILKDIIVFGEKSDFAFKKYLEPETNTNQIYNLVFGVLRYYFIFNNYLKNNIKRMPDHEVQIIMMMGIYELNFMNSSKDYAVYSQYLNFLDFLKLSKFKALFNGVLAKVPKKIDLTNILKMYPKNFISELKDVDIEKYLLNTLEKPKLAFILNSAKDKTKNEILDAIDNYKIFLNTYYYSDNADLLKEDFLKSGYIYIQDIGAQLVADLINYDTKVKVLDLCSAPGGKTINIAIKLLEHGNNNSIISVEKSKFKYDILESNIKTLGLNNVVLLNQNILDLKFNEEFDYIVLDPPCSALGTYRRHPEVLFNSSQKLNKIQLELLNKAKDFLKPGGKIIYSVCTFTKGETTDVISEFLKNSNFRQLELPEKFKIFKNSFFINTAMYNDIMDTHFITVLEKTQ